MAIIKISKAGRTKAALKAALNYITNEQKTTLSDTKPLITALNCWGTSNDIYKTMIATKEMYRKDQDDLNSEMYKHFQQSFQPGEVQPQTAHKIGIQWADVNFAQKGFEVCIATHIDREHIHNHFIINSVNAVDGKTLEIHANKTLEQLKTSSDELCLKYGLSVIERQNRFDKNNKSPIYSMKKRYSILNQEFRQTSWQQQIYTVVKAALDEARGKSFIHFEQALKQRSVSVNYKRLRDDLIFTLDETQNSISDRVLEQTFPPTNDGESLLRKNIENSTGPIPEYKLNRNEILSAKKQGFYRLIENLIKVVDCALSAAVQSSNAADAFRAALQAGGWQIVQTDTGRAFYNEQAKRYIYDSTIYKITNDSKYCLVKIDEQLNLLDSTNKNKRKQK